MRALGIAVVLAATLAAFSPLAVNQFVNYDDPSALLQNEHLTSPGVVRWAFTTDLLGHFQPLSWLVWSTVKRVFGPNAAAFHALSLLTHLLNAVLVALLTIRLSAAVSASSANSARSAVIASALFAIHPTRVEPIAWASAFPYTLALVFLLLSTLAYVRAGTSDQARARWFALSVGCYLLSLLSRPVAIGFPLV